MTERRRLHAFPRCFCRPYSAESETGDRNGERSDMTMRRKTGLALMFLATLTTTPALAASCHKEADFAGWLDGVRRDAKAARHLGGGDRLRSRRGPFRSGDRQQGPVAGRVLADLPRVLRPDGRGLSRQAGAGTDRQTEKRLPADREAVRRAGPGHRLVLGARDRFRRQYRRRPDARVAGDARL